jgi:hypothetical protein
MIAEPEGLLTSIHTYSVIWFPRQVIGELGADRARAEFGKP